ncbi:phosphogluconate dehydratase [Solirubrobacter ginsenosidimutans]|uniref:Phosphogluconate dehydratase n=2 Tax=Solirubrobacter ginsenosidimutans TaxID=490573 RepID=A0A9X3S6D4_9ACTN|nr:phosphogluconate dehydratase [Solirubrobacter ginsenosidimutans]
MHPVVMEVTARIAARSASSRSAYLDRIRAAGQNGPARGDLGCANLAHGLAACGADEKLHLKAAVRRNVAIVSSYNDMLSAHQPYERYPSILKKAVLQAGGVAQVAGGVPAMCDGITQGRAGMELSLFSRDVVAMSTAIALSHDMFDGALMLGVCDKIVPGLLIGALSFGHLPTVFVPAGPMPSGIPNGEKSRTRQRFAAGEIGRDALLDAELASYHSPGTCTFYGTANSNQLVVEAMGLHLPGSSFVNPGTELRRALTNHAGRVATQGCAPIGEIVDERTLVNGVVALLATGGSTNHTMHLVAIAAAAGLNLTWDDFADLSAVTPLLTRIYPNGAADINQFHAAGGVPFVIGELLDAGLMHPDVETIAGFGLGRYRDEPYLDERDELCWRPAPQTSRDDSVLRPVSDAFAPDGGIRVLDGGLGRAVMKVSSVAPEHRVVTAPARVFDDQGDFLAAFDRGELYSDIVAVIRHQGPRANGMPELHKLTPALGLLMDRGHRVALVTDGRMSGASGKIPAALHCTPEAAAGGPLSRLRDGDVVRVDSETGRLDVDVDLSEREPWIPEHATHGTGRELFAAFRERVGRPDAGASVFSEIAPSRIYA